MVQKLHHSVHKSQQNVKKTVFLLENGAIFAYCTFLSFTIIWRNLNLSHLNSGIILKCTQIILNYCCAYVLFFSDESSAKYYPYQYVSFSAGPRNCIGIRHDWINRRVAPLETIQVYNPFLKIKQIVLAL